MNLNIPVALALILAVNAPLSQALFLPFTPPLPPTLRIKRVIVHLTLHLSGLYINGSGGVGIEIDKNSNDQNIKEEVEVKNEAEEKHTQTKPQNLLERDEISLEIRKTKVV